MVHVQAAGDNWIHVVEYEPGRVFVVDPGYASGVLEFLEERALALAAILVTHHHMDHVGGVLELKKETACQVVGPDPSRIKGVDRLVRDGEEIEVGQVTLEVIATPGHTSTSVCYYSSDIEPTGAAFTGDTLFFGGCGRLFEGSGEQMYQALSRLARLPDETRVYCGHDYTVDNLEFAMTVDPDNVQIQKQLTLARQRPLSHSTVGQEKRSNVFLRAGNEQAFVRLRKQKDRF